MAYQGSSSKPYRSGYHGSWKKSRGFDFDRRVDDSAYMRRLARQVNLDMRRDMSYDTAQPTYAPRQVTGGRKSLYGSGANLKATNSGSVIVSHTDFVKNVNANSSTTYFNPSSFVINAGNEVAFPWLSQVSLNYGQYKLKKLRFRYKPRVNNNNSTTAVSTGTVIMCMQYNPDAPEFNDKTEMMDHFGAVSASSIDPMYIDIDTRDETNAGPSRKYVRIGDGTTSDANELVRYDMGRLTIAVADTPSDWDGQAIGELFVDYEVELSKPRHFTAYGRGIQFDRIGYRLDGYPNPDQAVLAHLFTYDWETNGLSRHDNRSNLGGFISFPTHTGAIRLYKYNIPDTYSGYLEYRITWECYGQDASFRLPAPSAFTATGGGVSVIPGQYIRFGQKSPIEYSWPDNFTLASAADPDENTLLFSCAVRVHVTKAKTAGQNHIAMSVASNNGSIRLLRCEFNVTEYNPSPEAIVWSEGQGSGDPDPE